MYIVPKQVTNIHADLLDGPDSPTEIVKESATKMVSVEYKESFSELAHPSAIDKMLLPASPQLDSSAVEGNFEKQKQTLLDSSAVEGNFEKQKQTLLDSSAAEGNFEKLKQTLLDSSAAEANFEKMEQVINSQKLRKLKI